VHFDFVGADKMVVQNLGGKRHTILHGFDSIIALWYCWEAHRLLVVGEHSMLICVLISLVVLSGTGITGLVQRTVTRSTFHRVPLHLSLILKHHTAKRDDAATHAARAR
jgi:hypothetical protein